MRFSMRFWFILCCTVPLALPQSDAPTAGASKQPRLEGKVLSATGEPVRKASVELQAVAIQNGQPPPTYSASSDAEGKFVFDTVLPGRYTLTAEKTGFETGHYGARTPVASPTTLNLVADQELKDIVVVLTPLGVITGKVLDQDGDPLPSAQIMVMRFAYTHGRRQLTMVGQNSADDQGNFRVANLTRGRYYLAAQDTDAITFGAPERPPKEAAKTEEYVITYYPGVTDAVSASAIDVAPGAELSGIAIQLQKGRVFSIRGRAANALNNAPVEGIPVVALPKDSSNSPVLMLISRSIRLVRADGSFEIGNLSPGTYVLQNSPSFSTGGNSQPLSGRLEVTINNADVDGATLALGPGAELHGVIRIDGGDSKGVLAARKNGASAAGARPTVVLIPADNSPVGSTTAQMKDDGTFQMSSIAPCKYIVRVDGIPEGTYVKSVRFGSIDLTKDALDLTSGKGGTVEVTLSMNPAEVSGTLKDGDGQPLNGVRVTLWPKDLSASSPWFLARATTTDAAGEFKFSGLPPGEYYSAAWEDADSEMLQNSDFLALFTHEATSLKLSDNSHEIANLKLIPSDKVALEVAKLQ